MPTKNTMAKVNCLKSHGVQLTVRKVTDLCLSAGINEHKFKDSHSNARWNDKELRLYLNIKNNVQVYAQFDDNIQLIQIYVESSIKGIYGSKESYEYVKEKWFNKIYSPLIARIAGIVFKTAKIKQEIRRVA